MSKIPGRRVRAQGQLDIQMPLQKYFLFAGGALLTLLLATNWLLPMPPSNRLINSEVKLPVIRIHSALKGPEPVVIDTSKSSMGPVLAAKEDSVAPETVILSEWAYNEAHAHQGAPIRPQVDAYKQKNTGGNRQQISRKLIAARAKRRRPPSHHPDPLHVEPDPAHFRMTFNQFVPRQPKQASHNEPLARSTVNIFNQAW
jgi:hypothetical protein